MLEKKLFAFEVPLTCGEAVKSIDLNFTIRGGEEIPLPREILLSNIEYFDH